MYIMWIVMLSLSVIELVVSSGTGNVRSRSPSRRLVFDANNKFTGWASWEHHAACSIRCVSGYETETKRCCETGDNRLCYSLPWDTLKMYIGTCPNTTTTLGPTTTRSTTATPTQSTTVSATTKTTTTASSTAKPSTQKTTITSSTTKSTIATTQFSRTRKTSTRPTRLTTTQQLPRTLPPVPTTCAVCVGPKVLCEQVYAENSCSPPNNYCINTITNHNDGTREVDRTCGTFETCYRDWYLGSSDSSRCQNFEENNIQTIDFQCTYCCIKDNCNVPLRPSYNTLYNS